MNNSLITRLSASSLIAVLIVVGCFAYFFLAGSGLFHAPESLQTQITQGLFGALMLVCGYFYGASKKEKAMTADGTTTADISATITQNTSSTPAETAP